MSEKKDMSEHCFICNKEGLEGGCPECGRELLLGIRSPEKEATVKEMDKLKIPVFYKTNLWNVQTLRENYIEYVGTASFDKYCTQLHKCYQIIDSGAMPSNSAIISAPIGFSKTTWAYSCILKAYEFGYSVVPLIDTSQIKSLLLTSSENPQWFVNHEGFSANKYLTADILFVTVTKGPEYVYAYEVISQLLDIRSRLDKPVIFISDYTQRELAALDTKKFLERLTTCKGNINPYKYPASICFNPLELEEVTFENIKGNI